MDKTKTIKEKVLYVFLPFIEQKGRWGGYSKRQGIGFSKLAYTRNRRDIYTYFGVSATIGSNIENKNKLGNKGLIIRFQQ